MFLKLSHTVQITFYLFSDLDNAYTNILLRRLQALHLTVTDVILSLDSFENVFFYDQSVNHIDLHQILQKLEVEKNCSFNSLKYTGEIVTPLKFL